MRGYTLFSKALAIKVAMLLAHAGQAVPISNDANASEAPSPVASNANSRKLGSGAIAGDHRACTWHSVLIS